MIATATKERESLIILKSTINSSYERALVSFCLQQLTQVKSWNIDEEDVDKVIRIQLNQAASEQDYINLLCSVGVQVEPL